MPTFSITKTLAKPIRKYVKRKPKFLQPEIVPHHHKSTEWVNQEEEDDEDEVDFYQVYITKPRV